ncbi:MAG: hypothetical protein QXJ48_02810 [Candidatus Korarchaeum sp.]
MPPLDDIDIINRGIEAGTSARGVDRATINNILSVFYGEQDPVKGVILTQIYIARQGRRREITEEVVRVMMRHIKEIYDSFKGDSESLKRAMDLYFLSMKWSFESEVPRSGNVDEFVSKVLGGR